MEVGVEQVAACSIGKVRDISGIQGAQQPHHGITVVLVPQLLRDVVDVSPGEAKGPLIPHSLGGWNRMRPVTSLITPE